LICAARCTSSCLSGASRCTELVDGDLNAPRSRETLATLMTRHRAGAGRRNPGRADRRTDTAQRRR
jgi:hypothetical protein